MSRQQDEFIARVRAGDAVIGVVGLGYVGLPLAVESARAGYRTLGLDTDADVVAGVNAGRSHVGDVSDQVLGAFVGEGLIEATTDAARLAECEAVLICVPTPLSKIKDPDLSFVLSAARAVKENLRRGQLVILESTTYPGTTREVVLPVLEESGLEGGRDFSLCYSPERVDPGNRTWHTRNTPKVLGGLTPECTAVGLELYQRIFDTVVPVEKLEAAELVKVYENTFRMINIALVNELAQVCERLDVDVWSVIEAAATKPFGFMKFTPGPGLGGHCIPLDPHYLSWKMRNLGYKTRMIELASEINGAMPAFVVEKVTQALNDDGSPVRGCKVLVLGVAYKRDVDDLRESPAFEIMHMLQERGAEVVYHDPLCPVIQADGQTPLAGLPMHSLELTDELLESADATVIVTDHSQIPYDRVGAHARLVVDTRGVMRGSTATTRVVGLSGTEQGSARIGDLTSPVLDGRSPVTAASDSS